MQVILDTKSITDPAEKVKSQVKSSMKNMIDKASVIGNSIADKCNPALNAVKTYGLGIIDTKADVHFCVKCGFNIEEYGKVNFCPQCGKKI